MAAFLQAYLPPALTVAVDWFLPPTDGQRVLSTKPCTTATPISSSPHASTENPSVFPNSVRTPENRGPVDAPAPAHSINYASGNAIANATRRPGTSRPSFPSSSFQERKKWTPSPHFRDLLDLPESIDSQWLAFLPRLFNTPRSTSPDLPLDPIAENLALRVMIKVLGAILDPDPANAFKKRPPRPCRPRKRPPITTPSYASA